MPRKHTQKQSQKQVVNIRIGETSTKKKRKTRRRKSPAGDSAARDYLQPQSLAPTILLQTGFVPQSSAPPIGYGASIGGTQPIMGMPIPASHSAIPGSRQPVIEDIGQVGQEGPVTILDRPTKTEQLGELVEPVKQVPFSEYSLAFAKYTPSNPEEPIMKRSGGSSIEPKEPKPKRAKGLTRADLVIRYKAIFGKNPPRTLTKGALFVKVLEAERDTERAGKPE